jgi:hypothetical protein
MNLRNLNSENWNKKKKSIFFIQTDFQKKKKKLKLKNYNKKNKW